MQCSVPNCGAKYQKSNARYGEIYFDVSNIEKF